MCWPIRVLYELHIVMHYGAGMQEAAQAHEAVEAETTRRTVAQAAETKARAEVDRLHSVHLQLLAIHQEESQALQEQVTCA